MAYPAIYLDYTETEKREYTGSGILLERTKETRAGDYLDVEIYPLLAMDRKTAEARREKTREKQERANARRARKRFVRIVNANFGPGDYIFKFADTEAGSVEEAKRHYDNYIKGLRRRAKKKGVTFKHVYVIEETQSGVFHFHGVMTGNGWITRDEAEDLWKHEELPRVERAKKLQDGLTGIALYITKSKSTQKRMMAHRWGGSRNPRKPTETIRDRKFSKRAVMNMVTSAEADARTLFEKKYKGYILLEQPEIFWSEFLPGAYIYARMKRRDKA